jgi:hypothetical protein
MTEQRVATQADNGEKQVLIERLQQGRDRYLHAFDTASERDASWSKTEDAWSMLQCAEHVAVAEEQMLRLWEKLAESGSSARAKDERLLASVHDRSRKQQAPAISVPKGRCSSLLEALARFEAARERTLAFVANMPAEDLRSKVVTHPLAGLLDGYQLFTLMALHPERHGLQVQELRFCPEFPGSVHP